MAEEIEEIEEDDEIIVKGVKVKKQHFTIEESDFKMISSRADDCRFFDFYYMHTINKGKANERQEFKLEGYGLQLKNCLSRIAILRAGNGMQKEFKSFKDFVIAYQKQVAEVKRLFGVLPEIFE